MIDNWNDEKIRRGVIDAAAFLDCSNHPNAGEWASACRLAAHILNQSPQLLTGEKNGPLPQETRRHQRRMLGRQPVNARPANHPTHVPGDDTWT